MEIKDYKEKDSPKRANEPIPPYAVPPFGVPPFAFPPAEDPTVPNRAHTEMKE